MKSIVVNIVKIIGRNDHVLEAMKSLYNGKKITFENSSPIPTTLKDEFKIDSWKLFNWGIEKEPFDIELINTNIIKFKTYNSSPYEALHSLAVNHPNVFISIQYADEDFGYNVGSYKFSGGEEVDYYVPEEGTSEAVKLSLSIIDNKYCIFDYICDLDNDELEDGIDGSDEVLNTIIKHIYESEIITDIYPNMLQTYLINLAVENENYEYASELKKIINKTLSD